MRIYLVFALLLSLVVTIFAVQNNAEIDIAFLFWRARGSLALVLLITLALGVLIGFLVSLPPTIRKGRQAAEWKKKTQELEKQLEEAAATAQEGPAAAGDEA